MTTTAMITVQSGTPSKNSFALPNKRGPKIKIHQGPLPEHLKLLARLCVKHDGPGNLTYWDRVFEDAERQSKELFDMIQARIAKYPTFKKSRLRFLVDRPYRKAFNMYRSDCELFINRRDSPVSVLQTKQLATASAQSNHCCMHLPDVSVDDRLDLSGSWKQLASVIAKSELETEEAACVDCFRRVPSETSVFGVEAFEMKPTVWGYKHDLKQCLKYEFMPTYQSDCNFLSDGLLDFQKFMAILNENLGRFNKEERCIPEVFKEFAFHLSRARLYKTVCKCEWLFLNQQPICVALRTLLQKNRKVLIQCRNKDCFKSFLAKIQPLVDTLEMDRKNYMTCDGRAMRQNKDKAAEHNDAVSALLTLAHIDSLPYPSDGSLSTSPKCF